MDNLVTDSLNILQAYSVEYSIGALYATVTLSRSFTLVQYHFQVLQRWQMALKIQLHQH